MNKYFTNPTEGEKPRQLMSEFYKKHHRQSKVDPDIKRVARYHNDVSEFLAEQMFKLWTGK